eukprot:GHVR01135869.1.p1 GENE.GHVR01135869.1~~GHVR01135869.1.p1  ORF type:complete len:131 (+),score=4.74 GHVR01135869.1:32-394(+)
MAKQIIKDVCKNLADRIIDSFNRNVWPKLEVKLRAQITSIMTSEQVQTVLRPVFDGIRIVAGRFLGAEQPPREQADSPLATLSNISNDTPYNDESKRITTEDWQDVLASINNIQLQRSQV